MSPITRPSNSQGCQICNARDHLAIHCLKYVNSKAKCNSKHLQMAKKLDMSKQPQNLFAYIILIPMKNEELFMYYSLYLGSNGLIALRGIANVDWVLMYKQSVHFMASLNRISPVSRL